MVFLWFSKSFFFECFLHPILGLVQALFGALENKNERTRIQIDGPESVDPYLRHSITSYHLIWLKKNHHNSQFGYIWMDVLLAGIIGTLTVHA